MKSLIGLVVILMLASFGIAAPQTPAPPSGQQMSKMQQEMMARMSALDDQIKVLGAEMNSAKTVDAKLAAVTKVLNILIEQRSMMRTQMESQGQMMQQMMSMHQMMQQMMSGAPAAPTTKP